MKKYFAVSDVHSFTDRMLIALDQSGFEKDNDEHNVIICGDAFDRGNYSNDMFNWMESMAQKNRLIYVRGNHEDLLEECVQDIRKMRDIGRHHISNGTVKTIATIVGCTEYDILCTSFEWSVFDANIDKVLNFINKQTIDYYQLGNTVFVHGWVPVTNYKFNKLIVTNSWRDGNWYKARWLNGQEMFHYGIVPHDVETVVCGHWHTSWGWCYIKKETSEWKEDAKFDTLIHYNDELKSRIIALDACTSYTGKVNCVVFDENGLIIDN